MTVTGHTFDVVVQDARTETINRTLVPAELPSQFTAFTLRVALQVYGVEGEFSDPSDVFIIRTAIASFPGFSVWVVYPY